MDTEAGKICAMKSGEEAILSIAIDEILDIESIAFKLNDS